jgi:hypothetical protein
MAQGERPAAAVLKQLIPKASNDMSRNHLVSLQVLYFLGQCEIARCSGCARDRHFRGYASFEIGGLQKLFIGCGFGGCKRVIIRDFSSLRKKV